MRGSSVGKRGVSGGGNLVPHHKALGKILGGFQLRRRPGRTEDPQPCATERIHHTGRQRRFRADDRERNLFLLREIGKLHGVGDEDVLQPGIERGTSIARSDQNDLYALGLGHFPGQSMFTAARANNENFHGRALCDATGVGFDAGQCK